MERRKKREKLPPPDGLDSEVQEDEDGARIWQQGGCRAPAKRAALSAGLTDEVLVISSTPHQLFTPPLNGAVKSHHVQCQPSMSMPESSPLPPLIPGSADLVNPNLNLNPNPNLNLNSNPNPNPNQQVSGHSFPGPGGSVPYSNYPGGFPLPPPYSAWWGYGHHQAVWPLPYPGFPGAPAFPLPPPPPIGAFQRGVIRPPLGLSQKHRRLWDAQSTENIHLWHALARAETEICNHRQRILKLEEELHSLEASAKLRRRGGGSGRHRKPIEGVGGVATSMVAAVSPTPDLCHDSSRGGLSEKSGRKPELSESDGGKERRGRGLSPSLVCSSPTCTTEEPVSLHKCVSKQEASLVSPLEDDDAEARPPFPHISSLVLDESIPLNEANAVDSRDGITREENRDVWFGVSTASTSMRDGADEVRLQDYYQSSSIIEAPGHIISSVPNWGEGYPSEEHDEAAPSEEGDEEEDTPIENISRVEANNLFGVEAVSASSITELMSVSSRW